MPRTLVGRSQYQLFGVLLAAGTLGCGGNRAPATAPRPAASIPSRPAMLLLSPSWQSRVRLERADSIILTLPGGESQVQLLTRRASFTLTVGPRAAVTVRLDSLAMSPAPGSASLPLIGTVWTGRMLGTGVEWQTTAGAGPVVEDLSADVQGLFPRLRPGGVVAGLHWADTAMTKGRVDIFETSQRLTTQWTAGSDTTIAGAELLPLLATGLLEQSGRGSAAGVAMTMTGQGIRSHTYYLSENGQIRMVDRRDSVAVLISIPSSRQIVPTVRWIRSRAIFVPLARDEAH